MSDAKAECETLMSSILPFAEQMLAEHGEFFPFGGAMQEDGKIVSVDGYDGDQQPASDHVIRLIKSGLVDGARKGTYRATALVIYLILYRSRTLHSINSPSECRYGPKKRGAPI